MTNFKPSDLLTTLKNHLRILNLSDEELEVECPGSGAQGDYFPFKFGYAKTCLEMAIESIETLEKGMAKMEKLIKDFEEVHGD